MTDAASKPKKEDTQKEIERLKERIARGLEESKKFVELLDKEQREGHPVCNDKNLTPLKSNIDNINIRLGILAEQLNAPGQTADSLNEINKEIDTLNKRIQKLQKAVKFLVETRNEEGREEKYTKAYGSAESYLQNTNLEYQDTLFDQFQNAYNSYKVPVTSKIDLLIAEVLFLKDDPFLKNSEKKPFTILLNDLEAMKLAANTGYVSLADVKKLEDQFEEYKKYESILQKRAEQKPTKKFSIPLVSLKQLAAKNGLPLEMSPVTEDQGTVLRDIKRTTKIVVVDEKGKSTTYLLNDLNGIKGLKNYTKSTRCSNASFGGRLTPCAKRMSYDFNLRTRQGTPSSTLFCVSD